MQRRIFLAVLSVAVLLGGMWISTSAMWKSDGQWVRTRQDDELIAIALASKEPTIGVVYLLENPSDTDAILQKIAALGGSAPHIDRDFGYVRAVVPTRNVYQALTVPHGDVASVDLDLSLHVTTLPGSVSSESPGTWVAPPDTRKIRAEIESAATRKFLRASSPLLHDLDADGWRREHPTFDGRGVTIADVEMLPDLMIPEFSGALTLNGKPIRKVAGLHIVIDPNDRSSPGNDFSTQWVDMHAKVRGTTNITYEGQRYNLPYPGTFRIGRFDLIEVTKQTHWLNPKVLEPTIGDGVFAVLWDASSGKVWVDLHRSHDFRQTRALRDFNLSGDWSYFGAMHSTRYPLLKPAVSFVVLENPTQESVAIGLGMGVHADGVLASAAGAPNGPNDPVHGVAPAAQIASFEYQSFKLHSHAEALIAAFEDPKTDLVVYEWDSRLFTQIGTAGWFMSALGERLVQKFDKPLFVPGDNMAAIASIEEAGTGSDVLSVGASQSAASYFLYDGFRPSTNIHKHWGGLTDGPGQDGRLKPDLLAPSGYLTADTRYFWDASLNRKQGVYTLPPGLVLFGGTSQATPTAGGAAALLLSGAKQEGIHIHAAEFAAALRLGAHPSSELTAYEEGNGLLDVAATWKILTAQARNARSGTPDLARVCGGSVRTAWWPNGAPDGGTGIFETIGWHPGDEGSRTIRFCLSHPLQGALTASLLLNDGTYRVGALQTIGSTVEVAVHIQPRQTGFHSALLQLNDSRGRIVGRGMVTVAAAAELNAANHYSMQQKVLIPRPGYTATCIDVPEHTDALVVHADRDLPFDLEIQDPSGSLYPYVPNQFWKPTTHHSITIPEPMAGTWTVLLVDTHDPAEATRNVVAVEPAAASVSVQGVRVQRDASSSVTSIFAKVPVHEVGSMQMLLTESGQFTSADPVLIPIDVPNDTHALMIDMSGSAPWVDGYLFDCRQKSCSPFARIIGSGDDKRLTVPNIPPGHYYLALDNYDPAQLGTSLPSYRVAIAAYTPSDSAQRPASDPVASHAYEVNCEPTGTEIVATPKCGLFITR